MVALAFLPSADAEGRLDAFDASRRAGIYEISHTWSATAGDFNDDGWDDAIVVRHKRGLRLYRNEGGEFRDVRRSKFGTGYEARKDRHHCVFGDVDRNGDDDIYCTVGGRRGTGPKSNQLWMRQRDRVFRLETSRYHVRDRWGRGRFATFLDADGDRWPDLFVANQFPRTDGHRSVNRLFLNVRGRRFHSAPRFGLQRELGGNSVQAIDFDRDGWEDLALCGDNDTGAFLFHNRRGNRFDNARNRIGNGHSCRFIWLARLNGDSRPDLVRLTSRKLVISIQRNGRFGHASYARRVRGGRSLAVGDVNGDRRGDVYVVRAGPRNDRTDLMLLNRRSGRRFVKFPIPQSTRGIGDSVTSIDYDRNGLDDFIVMNGHLRARGPIRLIAFRR